MLIRKLPFRLNDTVAWMTLPVQERNPKRLCQHTERAHLVVDLDSPERVYQAGDLASITAGRRELSV